MANTTNFGWETPDDTDLVKDGAAAIRTLGSSIDTSFVDLKGGTTGQVLAKASNTDLDFTWSAADPLSILDAKGDLISATAADTPARLAVGTNGQVLTADSTAATGLKWATPSSGGMTLIATGTGTGSSATISFTSIPSTYKHLMLVFEEVRTASGGASVNVKFNSSSANYDYRFAGTDTTNDWNSTVMYTFYTVANTDVAGAYSNGVMWMFDYAGSHTNKTGTGLWSYGVSGGSSNGYRTGTFRWRNSAAISSIDISNGGPTNFGTATVLKLYGVS